MSVFTFMGQNMLRQDDNYSFHVIQHTIETVIPPLVNSSCSSSSSDNEEMMVLDIIKVFVNAYSHIPLHRRLRLFTILLKTLGVKKYLAPTLVLLFMKRSAHNNNNALLVLDDTMRDGKSGAFGNKKSTQYNNGNSDDDSDTTTTSSNNSEEIPVLAFCESLVQHFTLEYQINSFIECLEIATELPAKMTNSARAKKVT